MSKLNEEMKRTAFLAGGSVKTKSDRIKNVCRFGDFMRAQGINIEKIDQIKIKHIELYVATRIANNIGKRTMMNEMSAIRKIMIANGRVEFSSNSRISNEGLGLAGASRKGTKHPIPADFYKSVLNKAMEYDVGFAAGIMLSRHIGLRAEEIVQSNKSIKTWKKKIDKGEASLRVIYGTKGNRPRNVTIHNRIEVTKAVDFALSIIKSRSGKLIDKDDLRQAMAYFQNTARTLGLIGKYSVHSIRYAFAEDATRSYLQLGHSKREAFAQTSLDLGHGDGRGRWVKSVYNLSLVKELANDVK